MTEFFCLCFVSILKTSSGFGGKSDQCKKQTKKKNCTFFLFHTFINEEIS